MNASFSPESPLASLPAASYRDRSGGLMAFGIVQLILGGLAALAIPLMLLGALISRRAAGGAMPAGTYVLNIVSYAIASAALVALGVGSLRARRWARALTLVLSWMWLIVGVMMTVLLTAVLPATFVAAFRRASEANTDSGAMPTGVMAVILTVIIVLFSVFFVVLPLVFVLFYRKKDVEETVRHRDPVERWTDRCPLPVLGASLIFAWACPYYLLMSFTTPLVPFFGRYLTGVPGATGCLLFAALDGYFAYSMFHLRIAAWWIAVTALALRIISSAVTFLRGDLLQAYSRMGWKSEQLQMMNQSPMFRSHLILWWSTGFLLAFLGYMLWIKRYFRAPGETNLTVSPDSYGAMGEGI